MLKIKCAYWFKLFLICALATIMLSTVEICFNYPVLFIAVTLLAGILIRISWHSALKDEARVKTAGFKVRQRAAPKNGHRTNRAA
jgi:hypothetical protein